MTVSITHSLLLFIILQGSILSITCFSFPQFQQIRMDFWYLWNLTYQIDENSAAENIQYMNLIHHKSKLKREFIPNSESLCGREASFCHTSMISLFACRKDTSIILYFLDYSICFHRLSLSPFQKPKHLCTFYVLAVFIRSNKQILFMFCNLSRISKVQVLYLNTSNMLL